jgi:hypothetical protein
LHDSILTGNCDEGRKSLKTIVGKTSLNDSFEMNSHLSFHLRKKMRNTLPRILVSPISVEIIQENILAFVRKKKVYEYNLKF